MNLPDMLRSTEFFVEYRHAGYYTELHIGPELAALVEAADALRHHETRTTDALLTYDTARAALAAKIGGTK